MGSALKMRLFIIIRRNKIIIKILRLLIIVMRVYLDVIVYNKFNYERISRGYTVYQE